jgi:hypothetical protein
LDYIKKLKVKLKEKGNNVEQNMVLLCPWGFEALSVSRQHSIPLNTTAMHHHQDCCFLCLFLLLLFW